MLFRRLFPTGTDQIAGPACLVTQPLRTIMIPRQAVNAPASKAGAISVALLGSDKLRVPKARRKTSRVWGHHGAKPTGEERTSAILYRRLSCTLRVPVRATPLLDNDSPPGVLRILPSPVFQVDYLVIRPRVRRLGRPHPLRLAPAPWHFGEPPVGAGAYGVPRTSAVSTAVRR